uniref:Uncharacterized protein n=1 Tax=Arundo donax TaxID=35708 RepID=A0A0A9CPN7_ARUDO
MLAHGCLDNEWISTRSSEGQQGNREAQLGMPMCFKIGARYYIYTLILVPAVAAVLWPALSFNTVIFLASYHQFEDYKCCRNLQLIIHKYTDKSHPHDPKLARINLNLILLNPNHPSTSTVKSFQVNSRI